MKKLNILIALCFFFSVSIYAQTTTKNETRTTYPTDGKYEIITSGITMRDTYMLNRETGDTWQLVSTSYGYAWEKIERRKVSNDTIPDGHKGAVYQITMSGIAAKGIYLTNTLTGATWSLYEDKDGNLFWGSIYMPD